MITRTLALAAIVGFLMTDAASAQVALAPAPGPAPEPALATRAHPAPATRSAPTTRGARRATSTATTTATAAMQTPLLRLGEELTYAVHSTRLGSLGKAQFKVTGPDTVDGLSAFVLSFDFSAKVALFKITDRTRSWVRTDSLSMIRYSKHERSPISKRDEDVVVDRELGQWADGKVRAPLASDRPLDELSYIYLVRSLDLEPSESVEIRRHFDVRRNPVRIEAESREAVNGIDCVVYVMQVPDPRQKKGTSAVRFFITNDDARLPLRIESHMPMAGTIVMTLESVQFLPHAASK